MTPILGAIFVAPNIILAYQLRLIRHYSIINSLPVPYDGEWSIGRS